jgi:hypothetical protein
MPLDLSSIIAVIAVIITIVIAVFSENNHKYIESNENTLISELKPIIDSEITNYQNATAESEKRDSLRNVKTFDSFRIALKDEGEILNYGLLYLGACVVYFLVLVFFSPYVSLGNFFQNNPPLPTTVYSLIAEFILLPIMLTAEKFSTLWKLNKIVRGRIKKNEDLKVLINKYFVKRKVRS